MQAHDYGKQTKNTQTKKKTSDSAKLPTGLFTCAFIKRWRAFAGFLEAEIIAPGQALPAFTYK